MQRSPSLGPIVAAAHGLAVDGDHVERLGPAGADPVHEACGEQVRIDPVHHDVEPAPGGNPPLERQEATQKIEMPVSPPRDGFETVALGDRGADAQKQNLVELVCNALRTSLILDPGKVVQQKPQPRGPRGAGRRSVHEQAPNQEPHRFSLSATRKCPLTPVRSPAGSRRWSTPAWN